MEDIKRLFKQPTSVVMRLLFWVALSVVLLFSDYRFLIFHQWRERAAVMVLPLRTLVDAPIYGVHAIGQYFSAQKALLAENKRLKAEQTVLRAELQRFTMIKRENSQLLELLRSRARVKGKVLGTRLLAIALHPTLSQVIINKGKRHHVFPGQVVLDAYGVMGQVVDVDARSSKVLLVTDSRIAIPVLNTRNGMRAVAVGVGAHDHLNLIHIVDRSDIKEGDFFVTSGLGRRFPAGYPVGRVSRIASHPGDRFETVQLRLAAHLDQTQQALLVWPNKES